MKTPFCCDCCGRCCRHVAESNLYKDLDDGTGKCIYLDDNTNLCTIYDHRPDKCNIEKMYKYFADSLSWEEYYALNKKACEKLKEI